MSGDDTQSVFQFAGYQLVQVSFARRQSPSGSDEDLKLGFNVEVGEVEELATETERVVRVKCSFGQNDESPLFQGSVAGQGRFVLRQPSETSEGNWERFLKVQAPALVYTQIRPFVRQLGA